jgi:hypothetical protein
MTKFVVMRRADQGDEGIDRESGTFDSRKLAEDWVSSQKGEYYSPGDYYIVGPGDMPKFETTRGLPPDHHEGRVLVRHKEFGWMVAEWHFSHVFIAVGIQKTDGGPMPIAVAFNGNQVENALEWVGIP